MSGARTAAGRKYAGLVVLVGVVGVGMVLSGCASSSSSDTGNNKGGTSDVLTLLRDIATVPTGTYQGSESGTWTGTAQVNEAMTAANMTLTVSAPEAGTGSGTVGSDGKMTVTYPLSGSPNVTVTWIGTWKVVNNTSLAGSGTWSDTATPSRSGTWAGTITPAS